MKAWVLLMWLGMANGGPTVVANLSSEAACMELGSALQSRVKSLPTMTMMGNVNYFLCQEYRP